MLDGYRNDLENVLQAMRIPFSINSDKEWLNTHKAKNSVELDGRYVGKSTVPNVKGMSAKDAVFLIERTGMKVRLNGAGSVVNQSIAAGTKVYDGIVILTLN